MVLYLHQCSRVFGSQPEDPYWCHKHLSLTQLEFPLEVSVHQWGFTVVTCCFSTAEWAVCDRWLERKEVIYIFEYIIQFFKGLLHPPNFFLSLITYPHVVPNPLKLHSSSEHNLRYFGWKPGGLWLSHWLPSKYHCQGPEKSERHCQKWCYVKIIQQFVSSASP